MKEYCFYAIRKSMIDAKESGVKMPINEFERLMIDCFCKNEIVGFYAVSQVIVETNGFEEYARIASQMLSCWQIAIESIIEAKKT